MSTHKRIYDPDNNPFDVPEPRATDLILNQGWSQTKQQSAPAAEERAVSEVPVWRNRRERNNESATKPDTEEPIDPPVEDEEDTVSED